MAANARANEGSNEEVNGVNPMQEGKKGAKAFGISSTSPVGFKQKFTLIVLIQPYLLT